MSKIAKPIFGAFAGALFATAAIAQTTTPTTPPSTTPSMPSAPQSMPSTTTAPSTADRGATMLNDSEAKNWIDKIVYSSDNKNVGEVAAIQRDGSGKVTEVHADIGGFLGLGETRVRLMPAQFRFDGDRVVLNLTADQAKSLPVIPKQ
jgi:PRC-barrel domain